MDDDAGRGPFSRPVPLFTLRDDWHIQAACRTSPPDMFFPDRGQPGDDAKKVCVTCPVRIPCLEYALASREGYGVWGGLTERERTRLRKRSREIEQAMDAGETLHQVLDRMAVVRIGRGPRRSLKAIS